MKKDIQLLIIDPQNDFCDIPAGAYGSYAPTLPVPGAHADMQRLGEFIEKGLKGISDISVTLDSHHHIGIERPTFWMTADYKEVSPFTSILAKDVRDGKFLPRNPKAIGKVLQYLDALEAAGRYSLMVWPIHCEIGTWGHNVHDSVRSAYNRWEETHLGVVNKVTKGSNPWTEHYSALMAEVPDPNDHSTQLNIDLIETNKKADLLFVAGEAGSHCVKATMDHLIANFAQADLNKIILLTDCISPVPGFETTYSDWLSQVKAKGVQLATTKDCMGELITNASK